MSIKVFHEQPVFHRRRFFHGRALNGVDAREIAWLDPSGKEMSDEAWHAPFVRCLGVQLFGQSIDVDAHGETIRGDTMLLLFNADHTHSDSVRSAADRQHKSLGTGIRYGPARRCLEAGSQRKVSTRYLLGGRIPFGE